MGREIHGSMFNFWCGAPSSVGPRASTPSLPHHILALDGLRGVAILMVLFYHFAEWSTPQVAGESLALAFFRSGWAGVDLFFVLSGFLITGILYDARGVPHAFRNFYMRRVLRIFPLYYGVLAIVFLLLPRLGWYDTPELRDVLARQGYLWTYTQNLVTAWTGRMLFRADWLNVGHFWSLAIEEQFYLFWPILVLRLRRRTLIWTSLFIIAAAPLLRLAFAFSDAAWVTPYTFTLCRLDTLALGGLLAILLRAPEGLLHVSRAARHAVIGSGILLLFLFFWREGLHCFDRLVFTAGYSVLAIFFAGILVLAIGAERGHPLRRTLEFPLLRTFGKYSYALYVYHKLLEALVLKWSLFDRFTALFGSEMIGRLVAALCITAFFLGIAWSSWHLYEKHFLKLKRHFGPPRKQ